MKINERNFITLEGWMRADLKLSGNELIVYAIIYGFSQNKQGTFAGSLQYLADWVGCSKRTVMRALNKLVEEQFITKTETVLNNNEKRVSYQAEMGCEKTSQGVKTNNNTNNNHRDTNNVHVCSEPSSEVPNEPMQIIPNEQFNQEETPEEFFERAWQYYPNKRGKGQVSEKSKERLMSHGWDNVKRAIDRYLEDLKKDEWRQAQNGSTFFNSGYIDYLDENYEPPMNPKLDYSKTDLDDLF